MNLPAVRLKGRLASPHPSIWRNRVDLRSLPRDFVPGGLAVLQDGSGARIGVAMVHPHVSIAARVLTFSAHEQVDVAFLVRRLEAALALRRDVLRLDEVTTAYRLAHAEADGLPGLVIDVLGDVARVECYARGWEHLQPALREALGQLLPEHRVVIRGDRRSQEIEGFRIAARPDDPSAVEVQEHGVRFHVDLREGHKTGFFCDQRDNRAWLAGLCRGRDVLDVNTYTGGFGLHAARAGAKSVTGVDLDEKAIAVAKRNAKLNQAQIRFKQADAFPYLRDAVRAERRPDVLVLDPPKFAQTRQDHSAGLRKYADLNRLGLECLAEDGVLLTCSCSGVVSEEDLLDVLRNAAARTGRLVTLLRITGAAPDHPVALHVPETRYLKAVFARVRSVR